MGGMTAGQALRDSIVELPTNLKPPEDIQRALERAASRLTSPRAAEVILTLLGAAPSAWCRPVQTPLEFPRDHAPHLCGGPEWYWLTAVMEVEGSAGAETISLVLSMERQQAVSPEVQARAGWSDAEAQLLFSYACVIHTTPQGSTRYERRPNLAWPPLGGETEMGGDPFIFRCGPDLLRGSKNVMPLEVLIRDEAPGEPAMIVELTCSTDMPVETAFFLQGDNGLTPPPRPGSYYSWPQLEVRGRVIVGDREFFVAGKGWLDHEMMYADVPPLSPIVPPPARWTPPAGIVGWTFCDCNFDNGDALVAAGFQVGPMVATLPAIYGFYLRREGGAWRKTPVEGLIVMDAFMPLTAACMIPVTWDCALAATNGEPLEFNVAARPLYFDGSFMAANLSVQGETPCRLTLQTAGAPGPVAGTGYCESVGYEPPATFMARALAYLEAYP